MAKVARVAVQNGAWCPPQRSVSSHVPNQITLNDRCPGVPYPLKNARCRRRGDHNEGVINPWCCD